MRRLLATISLTIVALSSSMGWDYPQEFHPEALVDWTYLKHPNVEFYIIRIPEKQELRTFQRNQKHRHVFGKVFPVALGPYMSYEPQFPTTIFDFRGSDSQGDLYEITLDPDLFPKSEKKKIIYSGFEREVWRNNEFAVGMRPSKRSKR